MTDLIFFDEDDDEFKIFHKEQYFNFVCDIIQNFFNKKIVKNEMHHRIYDLIDRSDDEESVYNITSELPFYWSMCIIENKFTTDTLKQEELQDYLTFSKKYHKDKKINSFVDSLES